MPVDDRLARGLRANATSIQPEAEARLLAVRRRHRRRRAAVVAAVAAVAVVVAGAGAMWIDGEGPAGSRGIEPAAPTAPSATSPPTSPPTSSPDVPPTSPGGIPDSSWRRTVTRGQALALGLDRDFVRENFGDADRLPLVLSFVGGIYSQSGRYPGGWSVGDAGTVAYDGDRLVLTSTSPGCSGCTITVDWQIASGELRLAAPPGALEPGDRLMVVGSWSRQPS